MLFSFLVIILFPFHPLFIRKYWKLSADKRYVGEIGK